MREALKAITPTAMKEVTVEVSKVNNFPWFLVVGESETVVRLATKTIKTVS